MQVAYINSPAFNPTHYRLVTAVEDAVDDSARVGVLVDHLQATRVKFGSKASSTASTKYDLLLALYCRSQRPQRLPIELEQLFNLEWCLPRAVKLAGGGKDATLGDRGIGYRTCDEIFSLKPNALKLLLINTIRADLNASPDSHMYMARWTLGLRAIASPRLATAELVPAVTDRVLEMFKFCPSPHVRKLALTALLNLIKLRTDQADSLRLESLGIVKRFLLLPTNGNIRKGSSSGMATGEKDPTMLAALVRAYDKLRTDGQSAQDSAEALKLHLDILKRIQSHEWSASRNSTYRGVTCGWLLSSTLNNVSKLLKEVRVKELLEDVADVLLSVAESLLNEDEFANGILLDMVTCIGCLPINDLTVNLSMRQSDALSKLLNVVAKKLGSNITNERHMAIKSLSALAPELWSSRAEQDGPDWGNKAWTRLLQALEDSDDTIRKETIRLFQRVDKTLVGSHFDNLIEGLTQSHTMSATASRRDTLRDGLVKRLLEITSFSALDNEIDWSRMIVRIVKAARKDHITPVTQVIVIVVDKCSWFDTHALAKLAQSLRRDQTWKEDITIATVFAAIVGQGNVSPEETAAALEDLLSWLSNTTDTQLLQALQEPFILAILRILSHENVRLGSKSVSAHIEAASRRATRASEPMFALLKRCLHEDGARRSLAWAGKSKQASTLPGFFGALQRALSEPFEDASVVDDSLSDTSSVSGVSSTKISQDNDAVASPLRYAPYRSPTQASVTLSSSRGVKADEVKHRQLEKELARERKMRGGKGGIGESVMLVGAGELALMHADEQDSDSDTSDEQDSTPVQRSETSVHETDSQRPSLSHRRHSSSSSSAGQPPADLLIAMDELNPFK
ncbi:hypothetical protein OIO90_000035 [Microbotryomycetes sp. JL221]|nr:hypothetical protein OIO90_000035 [Microbotryomycetes sp. JL221]